MQFAIRWSMVAFVLVSMAHAETTSTALGDIPVPDQVNPANINPQQIQSLVTPPAAIAAAAPVAAVPVDVPNTLPGTYSWFAARNACQGFAGWHLPTIEELLSRANSFAYAGSYWSASEYGIGIAWSYDTITKQANLNAEASQLYVHCEQ